MTARLLAASAIAILVAACGGGAAPSATRAPVATPAAAATPPATPAATASPAEPTATPKPAILPGEPWLAFQSDVGGPYGVRLVRPDGTDQFFPTGTADGTEQLHPDWSPDGTRLVFSTMGAGGRDLWVTDADGANPDHIVVCDTCSVADEPAWSPDGSKIVFWRASLVGDAWVYTLETYDLATRTTSVIMQAAPDRAFGAPRWAPDGKRLVAEYIHRRKGSTDRDDFDDCELVIIDTTAAKPKATVLTDEGWPANPDWSPDGKTIVFFRPTDPERFNETSDLWTIEPDGSGLAQLTHLVDEKTFAVQPTFTPDGTRIVFVTTETPGGDWVMATVALDGSDQQPAVSSGYLGGVHPRFRPTP